VGNIAFVSRFYELVGDIDIPRSSLRSRALALRSSAAKKKKKRKKKQDDEVAEAFKDL